MHVLKLETMIWCGMKYKALRKGKKIDNYHLDKMQAVLRAKLCFGVLYLSEVVMYVQRS